MCGQPGERRPRSGAPERSRRTAARRENDAEIRKQYGVYAQCALARYVQQIGERLAAKSHRPQLKYTFTVLDSPEVNAFALPGGYIYITRGIMAHLNSEAELAAVLGHENRACHRAPFPCASTRGDGGHVASRSARS